MKHSYGPYFDTSSLSTQLRQINQFPAGFGTTVGLTTGNTGNTSSEQENEASGSSDVVGPTVGSSSSSGVLTSSNSSSVGNSNLNNDSNLPSLIERLGIVEAEIQPEIVNVGHINTKVKPVTVTVMDKQALRSSSSLLKKFMSEGNHESAASLSTEDSDLNYEDEDESDSEEDFEVASN